MNIYRRIIAALTVFSLSLALLGAPVPVGKAAAESYNIYELTSESSYEKYLAQHADAVFPSEICTVDISSFNAEKGADCIISSEPGLLGTLDWKQGEGIVSWNFEVSNAGFYRLEMTYLFPEQGRQSLSLGVMLDKKFPFEEAEKIDLPVLWKNANRVAYDGAHKNQVLPAQQRLEEMTTAKLSLSEISDEPLCFYLEKGRHTLTLHGQGADIYIRSIRFYNTPEAEKYADIRPDEELIYKTPALINNSAILTEAEFPRYMNSAVVIPTSDSTDCTVSPSHPVNTRYNTIGAGSWDTPGQTLYYEVTAPVSGYYALNLRCKVKNLAVHRKIYVNGAVPCAEYSDVKIMPASGWQSAEVTTADGETIYIKLEAGKNLIAFEAVLGCTGRTVRSLSQNVIAAVDYCIQARDGKISPEEYLAIADRLEADVGSLRENSGAEDTAELDILIKMLRKAADRSEEPEKWVDDLEKSVKNAENWVKTHGKTALEMDYFEFRTEHESFREPCAGFFERASFEFRRFIGSFFRNYSRVSEETETELEIWTDSGETAARIADNVIKSGYKVKVAVFDSSDKLYTAALAGKTPDAAIFADSELVRQLASRGLLTNLGEFFDYGTVASRYPEALNDIYALNGKHYAVPLTNTAPVLFYREDILSELGLGVPNTWQELERTAAVLYENNMKIGLGDPEDFSAQNVFLLMMSQSSEGLFSETGDAVNLSGEFAKSAFERWTRFYTNGFAIEEYDPLEMFRLGKMPIIIADFAEFYNNIANDNELYNKWNFSRVPGSVSGTRTDRSVNSSSTGAVIFSGKKNTLAAWDFISWFCSDEVQLTFARSYEAAAERCYPAASPAVLEQIGFSAETSSKLKNIFADINQVRSNRNSDSVYRRIYSAFADVVIKGDDPAAALEKCDKIINKDILSNRR